VQRDAVAFSKTVAQTENAVVMIRMAYPPPSKSAEELLALSRRLRSTAANPVAPRTVRRSDVVVRVRIPKTCFRLSPVGPRIAGRVRASVFSWLYQ
jgi:hypothetical protein